MVFSWCAGSLLFVAFVSSLVCPFFTSTLRGILCLHWTIINYLVSTPAFHPTDARCLLVSLATLIALLEHTVSTNKPELFLSSVERLIVCCCLLCVDMACAVYGQIANTEISLLIFLSHVTLAIIALLRHKNMRKLAFSQLAEQNSADAFVDSSNPFSFLGLHGFHYVVIVFSIVSQIPLLRSNSLLQHLIFISRSFASLGLIFSSPYLGGLVHAVKTGGARLSAAKQKCTLRKSLIVVDT